MINLIGISGKIGSGKDTVDKIIQYLTQYNDAGYTHPVSEKDFNRWLRNNHVEKSNWKIKKFEDKQKDIVCLLIGCTREQLEDESFLNKELGEEWWYFYYEVDGKKMYPYLEYKDNPDYNTFLTKLTPRLLLQLLGTEFGRDIIHPSIWVNALFADYKPTYNKKTPITIDTAPNWIITDVEFPNQAKAIKDRGGILIRVNRDLYQYEDTQVSWEEFRKLIFKDTGKYPIKSFCANYKVVSTSKSETALDNYENGDYIVDNNGDIEERIEKVREILIKEKII